MTRKAEKGTGTQGGNGTDTGLAAALAPLVAGMTATRASLLDWVHGRGVVALQEVFAAEAEGLAGPKGQHQVERTHHHWGRTATELTFGGRRIQVVRPRVRSTEGRKRSCPRSRPGASGIRWRPGSWTRSCWACRRAGMPAAWRRRRGAWPAAGRARAR